MKISPVNIPEVLITLITLLESFLAYEFCCDMLEYKMSLKVKLTLSLFLTGVIYFCHSIEKFSIAALPVVVIVLALSLTICYKKWRVETFFYSYLFYIFVYIFEYISICLQGTISDNRILFSALARTYSPERFFFMVLSKLILLSAVLILAHCKSIIRRIHRSGMLFITVTATVLGAYLTVITLGDLTLEHMVSWIMIFVLILLLYITFATYQEYVNERTLRNVIDLRNQEMKQQYTELMAKYQCHAKLYHDNINHLARITNLIELDKYTEAEEYVKIILKESESQDTTWTGNENIDYVINKKKKMAEASGIRLSIAADPISPLPVRIAAMNDVLSDLLDYSIRTCGHKKQEDRWIKLSVRRVHRMVILLIEKSPEHRTVCGGNEPVYDRSEKKLYGWEMGSIIAMIKKCDGSIHFTCNDNVFKVTITFF